MEKILGLLSSPAGKTIISSIAGATGQNSTKTENVLAIALPVLMKAIQRNASTPKGSKGLMEALNKHDGGILDNLSDLFRSGVNKEIANDGGKILSHVLGNKQQGVQQIIGQKTGMDTNAVGNILKTATPVLMGVLGKQSRQAGAGNAGGIEDLIGGMLGGNNTRQEQSLLDNILDADGDGNVIDDIGGMVLDGNQKKSGGFFGGMLGGLFEKK